MTPDSSGYRNVASGSMANEGSSGYYWSASPTSAANGLNLLFNSGYVSPQYNSNRGAGFPLRCIQEFALRGADYRFCRGGVQVRVTEGSSGYRSVGSGVLAGEGGDGFNWSASSDGVSVGRRLLLDAGSVTPQGNSDRGFGFPLRCIQGFALYGWNRCLDRSGVARKDDNRGFGLPQRRLGHDGQRGQQRLQLVGIAAQCCHRVEPVLPFGRRGPAER